jgi:hypothetical protein
VETRILLFRSRPGSLIAVAFDVLPLPFRPLHRQRLRLMPIADEQLAILKGPRFHAKLVVVFQFVSEELVPRLPLAAICALTSNYAGRSNQPSPNSSPPLSAWEA